ncbi:hypothetical protein MTR67_017674 [Solanum verrucosum]|uniref:Uncharacterized protein n=1 Tax=Solanum verrucosum TaxID=315347 RepID=A0AAF0QQR1_SOLVR|nr:hypothetical protein MTR67_017674 [Solanum verrucosum]
MDSQFVLQIRLS